MRQPQAVASLLLVVLAAPSPAPAPVPVPASTPLFSGGERAPLIALNGNTVPAGVLREGVLRLDLEVQDGEWHPLGQEKAGVRILAFAERGRAPSIPGPLVRIPAGTRVRVSLTNPLDSTLVVHGFAPRRVVRMDSLVVPPGATREAAFVADLAGTYYYWGTTSGLPVNGREFEDSQLSGAFVVDPPGSVPDDRVFVIGSYFDGKTAEGRRDGTREFLTINGSPWPHTERLQYRMGDSIRWRFINPTVKSHPMHLHGFYFRVDSRGDFARDTVYWPAEQRMAVTEWMRQGSTMSMVWAPDRPGGWLFHCHLTFHVLPNPRLGPEAEDEDAYERRMMHGDAHHDAAHHVENGMGGLMMLTTVRAADGWTMREPARRQLRLFVTSGYAADDTVKRYAYVLQEDDAEPAPDSLRQPASLLVLQRGEPTSIRIINRTDEPTQIHWHGMELDSYFDGVVGVGGHPGMPTPPAMPGDSFEVRMTPPRSGSFMYHTHMSDLRQQGLGLFGALLVVDDRAAWSADRDFVFLAGPGNFARARLYTPGNVPDQLHAGTTYRVRLMNVTLAGAGLRYWITMDGTPLQWMPVAKDGHDLPAHQRRVVPSHSTVSIGETLDVEVQPPRPGEMWLELRTAGGGLVGRHRFTVLPEDAAGPPGGP